VVESGVHEPPTQQEGDSMSTDEKMEPRDESESGDVEAHAFLTETADVQAHTFVTESDDIERKRKRKQYEEPADPEGGEFGKRRK
jgi:hypothetical protein